MTPAIELAIRQKVRHQVHEYVHDPASESYGDEAAEKLGICPASVFKTLVVSLNSGELVVAVLSVSSQLNMKKIAKAAGAKKAGMAKPADVERSTGYVLGGVSPLGQKKPLRTFLDIAAQEQPALFISAGRRGLEIELSPADLLSLTKGEFAALC